MTKSNYEYIKICTFCGNEFIALKSTTRYCSHTCNSKAYKENKRVKLKTLVDYQTNKVRNQTYTELNDKLYLSINETAKLLGVCKKTIYNYVYAGKIKATKLSSRLTIIAKKDILNLFGEEFKYIKTDRPHYNGVEGYYTIEEIKQLSGLNESRIWNIIRTYKIPRTKIGKFSNISKKHIDNYFSKK